MSATSVGPNIAPTLALVDSDYCRGITVRSSKSDAWYPRRKSARGGFRTFAAARSGDKVAPTAVDFTVNANGSDGRKIGIGGHLAVPPLPHHRAYGSRTRRFD